MRPLRDRDEIVIAGGGLAGLSAARHAARLGRAVTLLEGSGLFGGLVATIGRVDGIPAPGTFSGQDLAIHLLGEARAAGVRIIEARIDEIDLSERLAVRDEEGRVYQPSIVIVASGARLRKLGVPGEDAFLGRGVSRCATCDSPFFRDQTVVVVGGGDSAIQEALTLSRICRHVVVVSRSPLRAKRHYVEQLAGQENVTFRWDTVVEGILGDDAVMAVRLRNQTDAGVIDMPCAGVFPYVGVEPNNGFLPAQLCDSSGYVPTDPTLTTSDRRVLAAGAIRAGYGGDINQAIAEGIAAASAAADRLRMH
jgi:thioredoxin reductase (NADPH)